MTWWQRFLNWLGLSTPGGRREQVETWLSNNKTKIEAYATRQGLRYAAKGHYFQCLKGWVKPTDNDDEPQNDFAGAFPIWATLSVDVWEKPGKVKGWTLRIWVEEVDTTKWVLAYDSVAGLTGWTEVKELAP